MKLCAWAGGCEEHAKVRDYCQPHYNRLINAGVLERQHYDNRGKTCSSCNEKPAHCKGLCKACYESANWHKRRPNAPRRDKTAPLQRDTPCRICGELPSISHTLCWRHYKFCLRNGIDPRIYHVPR